MGKGSGAKRRRKPDRPGRYFVFSLPLAKLLVRGSRFSQSLSLFHHHHHHRCRRPTLSCLLFTLLTFFSGIGNLETHTVRQDDPAASEGAQSNDLLALYPWPTCSSIPTHVTSVCAAFSLCRTCVSSVHTESFSFFQSTPVPISQPERAPPRPYRAGSRRMQWECLRLNCAKWIDWTTTIQLSAHAHRFA